MDNVGAHVAKKELFQENSTAIGDELFVKA
jgi:hypothetical protein